MSTRRRLSNRTIEWFSWNGRLTDTTSIDIDCTDPTTAGPIVLDTRKSSTINVERTAGNPRYIVELLATTG